RGGAREIFGWRRRCSGVEIEHAKQHAEPTELDDYVSPLTEFGDAGFPQRKRFFFLSRVWTDAERPADMIQDDCRLGESPRQLRQLHQLRMVQPGLEGQVQRRQPRKPCTPGRVGHLPFWRVRASPR